MLKRLWLVYVLAGLVGVQANAEDSTDFRAGASSKDITPPVGVPMWGYGARHDALSDGTLDPLMAKAIVIAAGVDKLAIVGTDLGRGPTEAMMKIIRQKIADKAGIGHVLISGSHSHHGPVIELTDEPGLGKGKFDVAVAYSKKLPELLVDVILEADKDLKPAKLGVATESVTLNRNRHTKARTEGHRSDAGRPTLRRPSRQADRGPGQLRGAPGHDRRKNPQVLGRLSRFSQEQGGSDVVHQVRLHAGGGRRHEPQPRQHTAVDQKGSARRSPTM